MLLRAEVFRLSSRAARLLLDVAVAVVVVEGLASRCCCEGSDVAAAATVVVGGRCETQSCTSRDTRGLRIMLDVFWDEGLVVMMMVGWEVCGLVAR